MARIHIPPKKRSDKDAAAAASPSRAVSGPRRSEARPAAGSNAALARAARLGHNIQRVAVRTVQPKLTVGPVGDRYEQEADSVAREVMQRIAAPAEAEVELGGAEATAQRAPGGDIQEEEQEEKLFTKRMPGFEASAGRLQRADEDEEEKLSLKPASGGAAGGPVSADLERSIDGSRGSGHGLDEGVRSSMEPAFGADFGNVRIHTGSQADGLNRSLQARAFTTGQDIFFRSGEYQPGSSGGQELLAHELTHVVQQNGDAVARKEDAAAEGGLESYLETRETARTARPSESSSSDKP